MEEEIEKNEQQKDSSEEKPRAAQAITVKINMRAVYIVAALVLIVGGLYYFKGFFVAALVNGTPISRLSVIQELEKQSGKQAMDSLITKQLIESEAQKKNVLISSDEVNQEVKKIEDQLSKQGMTLQGALGQQGVTESQFKEQIIIQKKIEKILADKVAVSDAEVDTHIKDNKVVPGKDEKPEDMKLRIKEQLKQEKFGKEAGPWVASLKTGAKIQYFVKY